MYEEWAAIDRSRRVWGRLPRRLLLALAFGPLGATLGALSLSVPAGASTAPSDVGSASGLFSAGVPGTVSGPSSLVLQAVACASWDAVPANFTPEAPLDDTFGRYRLWGPPDPQLVQPVSQGAVGDGCHLVDGVAFRLSGTPYGNGLSLTQRDGEPSPYPPEATTLLAGVTGRDGAGTLHAGADQLTEPQRRALVDGVGLWVAANWMPGEFANLRCHDDRYNADNLEVLRADAADRRVACVLYMIEAAPVPTASPGPAATPDATPQPPLLPSPSSDPTTPDVAPPAPVTVAVVPATPVIATITGAADLTPIVAPPAGAVPQDPGPAAPIEAAAAAAALAEAGDPAPTVPSIVAPSTVASATGDGIDVSADRGVNAGGAERTALPSPAPATPSDPLALALRSELTVSLQVRKVGLGPLASTWGADGVVVAYRCGDEQPKKLKLARLNDEPARSRPLDMAGGALCEVAVEGPLAAGDEPAPRIVIDGASVAAGETVTLSVQPGGRRHVAVVVELPSAGLGPAEVTSDGPTTDTSLVAAGPVATGGSQLTATAAAGLGVLFLAGLGLSVVAARRPL